MSEILNHKYIIVVPVYKEKLSSNELLVVNNLLKHYTIDSIRVICPHNLNIPDYLKNFRFEKFDKKYFQSVSGYNKLLLSYEFYKRFDFTNFILIHQLDAFIFRDELDFWCDQNYDYIGAPWLRDERLFLKLLRSSKVKKREVIFNKVGNGGLSLRKVATFLHFLKKNWNIVNKNIENELFGIEDVFWSIMAPKYEAFKIPDVKTAARFALDRKPNLGMKMNNSVLPFGCHGFEKNKTKSFWKKHIKGLI